MVVLLILGGAELYPSKAAASACPNQSLRTGASASLPDCRAYEQVSPAEKNGNNAVVPALLVPSQATPDGEKLAYESYEAFPGSLGNPLDVQHVSTRTEDGWQTTDMTPAKTEAQPNGGYEVRYGAFSEDLSEVVLSVPLQQVTPESTTGVYNLFLRRENAAKTGVFTWVNAAKPKELPPAECEYCWQSMDRVGYAGASAGFGHVLFETNGPLTPEAPVRREEQENGSFHFEANVIESLYEESGGAVRLVGILPDGKPAAEGSTAGSGSRDVYVAGKTNDKRVEHAISENGDHVVFQAASDAGEPNEAGQSEMTEVYDRSNGRETTELSAPAPGATPKNTTAEPAQFWAASANGQRVFFTSTAELTSNANTGTENNGSALYEYDLETKSLVDLTPDANPLDKEGGPRVLGVVGASQNGSYVYFVAEGQLVEGHGTDGAPNLYMVHEGGAPVFVATLSTADSRDWTAFSAEVEAYVTPNGAHLAFMSTQKIPTGNFPGGYDNTDQITKAPDSEVYAYTAPTAAQQAAGEPGQLACGSCNPSGAPPTGDALIGGSEAGRQSSGDTAFYHVRALSEEGGRLFFTSPPISSANAPDLAGQSSAVKVYEYEQRGVGSCEAVAGCTYLISSPANSFSDYFLDASATGSNVFFATTSGLTASDEAGLFNVYDAREYGGFATPPLPPPCEGGCRVEGHAPVPGPPLLSSSVGPPENLTPPPATTAPAAVGRVKVVGHSVRNTTITLKVRAPARGRIVAYGAGLKTTRHAVAGAKTYTLKVTLSARARASVKRLRRHRLRHKLKLTVRVRFVPASGRASQTSVLAMVKA
ncbi:MAG: TolB-like translocation protein [Solirubrobacteraceae bacterium]